MPSPPAPRRLHERDTALAAAALDYGLSQRALIAVSARTDDITKLEITRRLTTLAHSDLKALDEPTVRAVSARPSATSAQPRLRRPPVLPRRCHEAHCTPFPRVNSVWCEV
ncbi:hypothetical protein ABT173_10030 [Streptomyces sp. NPDC001795]|uniref:hypothetical protein n=1 Tax=Streptomyces sp. NPDC001795 TaxID=3154525 RepID=UPI003319198F